MSALAARGERRLPGAERHPERPRSATLWGDGFAGDDLAALRSMADWNACSPDEYVMLFPRLLPRDGAVPDAVLSHLETCVAIRAWRLGKTDPAGTKIELRSRTAVPPAAPRLHRDWFADHGAVTCLLRQMGLLWTSPGCLAAERQLLALLDAVLAGAQTGRVPLWCRETEAWFAFGSGLHPAYLWPEAAISAERGCTAAWLGHLDRGRVALMPLAVAEFLLDAVVGDADPKDRDLVRMVGGAAQAKRLRRAAEQRCAGEDPKVAPGRARSFDAERDDLSSRAGIPKEAYGQA